MRRVPSCLHEILQYVYFDLKRFLASFSLEVRLFVLTEAFFLETFAQFSFLHEVLERFSLVSFARGDAFFCFGKGSVDNQLCVSTGINAKADRVNLDSAYTCTK